MESPTAPVAPAQPAADVPVLTSVEQAVVNDDLKGFKSARLADRTVAPSPIEAKVTTPVPVIEPPAPAAPDASRAISKRQQQINDYERRIAALAAENAQLRAPAAPPASTAPRSAAPVTGPDFPDYATYLETHPNTPLEAYFDARADWRTDQRATAARRDAAVREQSEQQQSIVQKAAQRFKAAADADPTFLAKLDPDLLALPTREQAIADRLPLRPEYDFASEVLKSEVGPQILTHLSQHPDVLEQVRALEARSDVVRFVGRLEAQFLNHPAPASPASKPVTTAPEPPVTLGSRPAGPADPIRAAVASDDLRAFQRARLDERIARTTLRR